MNFVFTRRLIILIAAGIVPLTVSWLIPGLSYLIFAFDALIVAAAVIDHFRSRKDFENISLDRHFAKRFAIGDKNDVFLDISNHLGREITLHIKDEYPPELTLLDPREASFTIPAGGDASFAYGLKPNRRGQYHFGKTAIRMVSKWGLVWCQAELGDERSIRVYPNIRRAREAELRALGSRSFLAIQRRAVRRGEGREFESMRDYVRGDELRHISWTATARRSKLITRQYQIERDQTVMIVLDAGRLMTGRIDDETKFEAALHSALAIMSACERGGDKCGLVVFGRKIIKSLPPKRGLDHIESVLEALHDIEPQMVEPSYARAFQYIASTIKKRSFVIVLTDVIDKESSAELINSLKLLRPRHLPLVATIGDRDLNAAVADAPENIEQVYFQSAAEEIILQRESALRSVEQIGGLALDVTAQTLAPKLLEKYLDVKERGLL